MTRELLIGCGHSRDKKIYVNNQSSWDELVTLDHYEECKPDVVHDLEVIPYPFSDNEFDGIHAYCVLEHLGQQGHWRSFFDQFAELCRITKPNGFLGIVVPNFDSPWAWGDPSHTRIISPCSFAFLDQETYERNMEQGTPMSDFRWYYKANWKLIAQEKFTDDQTAYVLKAIKEGV